MIQKKIVLFRRRLLSSFLFPLTFVLGPNVSAAETISSPIMAQVAASPMSYEREDYFKALAEFAKKDVSLAIYNSGGRMNVYDNGQGAVLTERYGMPIEYNQKLPRLLAALAQYPQSFKDLLVDHGIVNHADEFIFFLQSCVDCKNKNPWEVRRLAREAIGTIVVYRGVFITDREAERIQKNGFLSNAFKKNLPLDEILPSQSESTHDLIQKHEKDSSLSTFLSVSEHPEVSIAVARKYANESDTEKFIYLFKLEIPKMDLIYNSEFDRATYPQEREENKEMEGFYVTGENDKVIIFANGPDLESLVPFRIMSSEIIGMEKILEHESPYRAYQPSEWYD